MVSGLGAPVADVGFGGRGMEKHGVGCGWALGVVGLIMQVGRWGKGKREGLRLGYRVRVQEVGMGFSRLIQDYATDGVKFVSRQIRLLALSIVIGHRLGMFSG